MGNVEVRWPVIVTIRDAKDCIRVLLNIPIVPLLLGGGGGSS